MDIFSFSDPASVLTNSKDVGLLDLIGFAQEPDPNEGKIKVAGAGQPEEGEEGFTGNKTIRLLQSRRRFSGMLTLFDLFGLSSDKDKFS